MSGSCHQLHVVIDQIHDISSVDSKQADNLQVYAELRETKQTVPAPITVLMWVVAGLPGSELLEVRPPLSVLPWFSPRILFFWSNVLWPESKTHFLDGKRPPAL
jgi:hypothetical protein